MTPEERELRRALEARSGEPSPQFRARLGASFNEGRPASGLMQAVAVVTVVAITLGTVGALLLSRNARHVSHRGIASAARFTTPTPPGPAMFTEAADVRLSVPSANVVWALAGGRLLFRSMDKGNTWEQRSYPISTPNGWLEFSFINDRQGWLFRCANKGAEILQTTDGAATWAQVPMGMWTQPSTGENAGASPDRCKGGLLFTDASHGFLTAWDQGLRPTIYLTRDGGKNWTGVDLPDPPDFKTTSVFPKFSLESVRVMRSRKSLYVVASGTQPGDSDRNYVFRSVDGGGSWSWVARVPSRDVVVVTESRWLALKAPGDSMESTDSGQQWHMYASDFNAGNARVTFGDSQVGYAGGYGAIMRTLDSGSHWERISAPGMPEIDLLPVSDPGFTCRLAARSGAFGNPSNGGFIAVPRGPFEFDPAATMVTVNGQAWSRETSAQPVLKGQGGVSFDAPLGRWVPTSPEGLSSDGSQYAWTESELVSPASGARTGSTPRIHLTRVADGTDRSFSVGPPADVEHFGPVPIPIGVTKDGVLVSYGWEGFWGVWRLDLASGSLTKLTGLPSPRYGAGAIWVSPQRGANHVGMYSDGDTLARFDMKSGMVQDWYHRDGVAIYLLGFDMDGNPWVQATTFGSSPKVLEIWRVRSPGQADLVLSGQRVSRISADSHGTWFGNETGAYLYSDGRVQRVSAASVGEVVGPCI